MNDHDKEALIDAAHNYWDQLEVHLTVGWSDSSPHGPRFRTEMRERAQAILSQMQDDEPAKPPKLNAAARRRRKAEKRLGEIMAKGTDPPIDAEEFLDLMKNPVQGDCVELENAAFIRLLRGYNALHGCREWPQAKIMEPFLKTGDSIPIDQHIAEYAARNKMEHSDRLTAHHRALAGGFGLSEGERLSQHILEHVSVASFAIYWLSITGDNSYRQKTAFYVSAYQDMEEHRDFFASLDEEERDLQMKNQHHDKYKEWRRELEPEITACNRYVELYRSVSVLHVSDPYFSYLLKGWSTSISRSLLECQILDQQFAYQRILYPTLPLSPEYTSRSRYAVAQSRYFLSKRALQGTVKSLNNELWSFLQAFMKDHPDDAYESLRRRRDQGLPTLHSLPDSTKF
ncbi:hypothetical protein B0H11DRAFT_1936233 [Mycena galericulata]|nr:hypothetical protein B0H11DRAFT_1936233 [Mycena galericulata]